MVDLKLDIYDKKTEDFEEIKLFLNSIKSGMGRISSDFGLNGYSLYVARNQVNNNILGVAIIWSNSSENKIYIKFIGTRPNFRNL